MNTTNLGPTLAIAAVAAFGMYRRMRRNIGRQALNPKRLALRIALFAVICAVVVIARPLSPAAVAYLASGTLVGVAVAWFALRHTGFEFTPQGNFYTPHLYIGLAVTALLVGRIVYRMVQIYSMTNMAGGVGAGAGVGVGVGVMPPGTHVGSSPLTLGILFLTASYYVCYSAGLLQRARRAAAAPGAPTS